MSKANFNESRKIGVELVSRDASGNLLTWRENGYDMAVARDASGNVTTLTASGPAGSYKMTIQRDAKGNYIGQTGDYLQSAMLPEIIGGGGNVLIRVYNADRKNEGRYADTDVLALARLARSGRLFTTEAVVAERAGVPRWPGDATPLAADRATG